MTDVDNLNGFDLLKTEMENEEIHLKVNAIHRMQTVIVSIGPNESCNKLIPYLDSLLETQEDEVLYAVAEELGKVYVLLPDKTSFMPILEKLAKHDETVVRERASESLNKICESLTDADVQNVFAPLVIKLGQCEWFPGRQSACSLFVGCYRKSGPQKEKLRKKFIELCNEDTPMIRRACAKRLGDFATQLEKQHILQEILPIFRQLSQDEQDTIRVMCLESLIPMAQTLTKEENQIHTLGTLLAAGEDKSWKVRLAFAKNFAKFAGSFGKEITDNNLIQTFCVLLNDNEAEVKLAAVNSIADCLPNISTEKIGNLILPTLTNTFQESTAQYRAGTAHGLCSIASYLGPEKTTSNILPILLDLCKDDNHDVKLEVIMGVKNVAPVVGAGILTNPITTSIHNLTKDNNWRVKMVAFETIGMLGEHFGVDAFRKHLQVTFFAYLENTAASVRNMGVARSEMLAMKFGPEWVCADYIPKVTEVYKQDKKGYSFRMSCLKSFQVVMPLIGKDKITELIIPVFLLACKDDIPNVKFTVAKVLADKKQFIDSNVFSSQLVPLLKDMAANTDKDVAYFAVQALSANDNNT